MKPRNFPCNLWALAVVLAATLLPASAFAQAGLSGNALSGQAEEFGYGAGQFDRNYTSKSALGQLEEMTGSKVDRSSGSRNTTTRSAPQSRPSAPRFNANQMLRQEMAGALAGALVGALFANIFDDNSAQQKQAAAEAAAAQAAAQAEAFRVQQELAEFARKARIKQAQRYRAEWDAREAEVGDRLGGAFDVGTGTGFFGQPAGPNADVAAILSQVDGGEGPAASGGVPDVSDPDTSVVDLRGSSGVVQLFTPPARTWRTGHVVPPVPRPEPRFSGGAGWIGISEPPPPPSETDRQLQGLIAFFGPWLGDYYKGFAKSTVKETIWARLKFVPGQEYAKKLWGSKEQVAKDTEELSKAYNPLLELGLGGATNAVNNLGSYSNRDGLAEYQFDSIQQRGGKVVVDVWKMIFKQFTGRAGKIDLAKLRYISDESSDMSLHDVPVHPDYPRLMFGSRGL